MERKKSLKKGIAMLLCLILCIQMSFAGMIEEVKADGDSTSFTVTSSESQVERGGEFTVSVNMGATKAQGITASLFYDSSQLEVTDKEMGGGCLDSKGQGFADIATPQPGEVRAVSAISDINEHMAGGNVFNVTFLVKDNAKGNVTFSLDVSELIYGEKTESDVQYKDITPVISGAESVYVPVAVTGVSLDKESLTLNKGETAKLQAAVTPQDADEQSIKWSSSDETVASVDNGNVIAKGKGTAVITASVNGKSASCNVTVTNALTGLKITGSTQTLKKGQSTKLNVQYEPEDADINGNLTWSSSDTNVASVTNGTVTAVGDGTATITASVGKISGTYSITVKEVHLDSISIKKETTIHRGESETLAVTYNPEETTDDKKAIWSSTDESIATVDVNGTVTAKNIGKTIIKATVAGKESSCVVTVDAPLKEITAEKELSLIKGQSQTIAYKLNPEDTTDDKTVTFVSSDESVASVETDTGKVTALKAGTTTITLKGANNVTTEVVVNVAEIPINELHISEVNKTLEIGENLQLSVIVNPENTTDDKSITWKSSDKKVASVDANGLVTAVKGGKAIITATSSNGKTASCEITVPIHMTGIKTPENMEILKGNTGVIKVEYLPADTTDSRKVTWKSDNEQIAVVDEDGMVTALKEGTANITATAGAFSSITAVTVKEIHLESIELATDVNEILKGQTFDLKAVLKFNPENTTDDKTVTWTTSDEKIAVVDKNGLLTAVSAGTVVIKAQAGEVSSSLELHVKEIPLDSIAFDKVIETMEIGEKAELGIIYNPENTTDVKDAEWYSSDDEIISVEKGVLTANKAGKAVITARVGEKTVSCEIKVNKEKEEVIKPVVDNKGDKDKNSASGKEKTTGKTKTEKAKTSQGKNVKTGDTNNPMLYVILMLLMADVIGVLLIVRKRKYC